MNEILEPVHEYAVGRNNNDANLQIRCAAENVIDVQRWRRAFDCWRCGRRRCTRTRTRRLRRGWHGKGRGRVAVMVHCRLGRSGRGRRRRRQKGETQRGIGRRGHETQHAQREISRWHFSGRVSRYWR